jgi:2,5-diketo-D-gluconate reductase B
MFVASSTAELKMQSAKAPILTAHGAKMPAIGFGTMELPHRPAELVAAAIAAGYRHIDTARKYGTEERVGEGIRASGIAREDLFVTTKVTELDAREADFLRSAETSLKALALDYVDLLLVHWPQPKVPFTETLGALAKAKRRGSARLP